MRGNGRTKSHEEDGRLPPHFGCISSYFGRDWHIQGQVSFGEFVDALLVERIQIRGKTCVLQIVEGCKSHSERIKLLGDVLVEVLAVLEQLLAFIALKNKMGLVFRSAGLSLKPLFNVIIMLAPTLSH